MSDYVAFLENHLHLAVLAVYCLLCLLRLLWLASLRAPRETARPKASARAGVLLSFGTVFVPAAIERTGKRIAVYVEFALFHIAIAVALAATFIHPFAKSWLTPAVVSAFAVFLAIGVLMGLLRAGRRVWTPELRAINTPDDYFAITVITLYLAAALWALVTESPLGLAVYFSLTALLMLYIPFSKVWHYLYVPFTRFYHGFVFGRRGVVTLRQIRRWI